MFDSRYLEEQIDSYTYPAKLPTNVRRLLAAKMHEIETDRKEERIRLNNELQFISRTKYVDVKQLPAPARPTARKLIALTAKRDAEVRALKAKLEPHGVTYDYGRLMITISEVEYVAAREQVVRQLTDLDGKINADQQALLKVAKGLADAQIKELRTKIAAIDPELLATLNAIGKKELPAETETAAEKKVGKGKSKKALNAPIAEDDKMLELRQFRDL